MPENKQIKVCTRCDVEKPLIAYHACPKALDGRRSECADCDNARKRAHYRANRATENDRTNRWRKANRERWNEIVRNQRRRKAGLPT